MSPSSLLLSQWTTLEVGGAARRIVQTADLDELRSVLADGDGGPIAVLGGGSNLLVADEGWPGTVVQWTDQTLGWRDGPSGVRVQVGGGLRWDTLVAQSVDRGLGALAELSGIPGSVGAAPIQNIGAYGREIGEFLQSMTVIERATGEVSTLPASELDLAYRWSRLKGAWRDRFLVLDVELELPRVPRPTQYPELVRRIGSSDPSPEGLRCAVLGLRRSKSMVLDPQDENRRSAGSFFLNPVVSEATAAELNARAASAGEMPCWPAGSARTKLSAAWLIERAGFARGWGVGSAGLSTRHTLALVNRGGASAADLVALARTTQAGVWAAFGVWLDPEVQCLGFRQDPFPGAPSLAGP